MLRVANTPTVPLRVCATAGLTAGSMATMGSVGKRSRSWLIDKPVTVLHATTTAFTPLDSKKPTTFSARS